MFHHLDFKKPTVVYKSDCYQTHVTVEAALICVAETVQGNTATSSVDSKELVSSAICKASKLNWQKLGQCISHLNKKAIPVHRRRVYGNEIIRPAEHLRSQPLGTPVSGRTRRQLAARSNP